jgi:PPM family protein phosphatase
MKTAKTSENFYWQSHIGKIRQENQDRCLAMEIPERYGSGVFLAIADGMGGGRGGGQAASIAIESLEHFVETSTDDSLTLQKNGFRKAHEEILEIKEGITSLHGMGTTCSSIIISGDLVWSCHIGDSRIYHYSAEKGELKQLTKDDNIPGASHLLTKCLGCGFGEPATGTIRLQKGDWLLLTTDGFHHQANEKAWLELLSNPAQTPKALTERLLSIALATTAPDNISLVAYRHDDPTDKNTKEV